MSIKFRIKRIKRELNKLTDKQKRQVLNLTDDVCPNDFIIYWLDELLESVEFMNELERELKI